MNTPIHWTILALVLLGVISAQCAEPRSLSYEGDATLGFSRIAVSPDGTRLLASGGSKAYFWSLPEGKYLGARALPRSVVFTPDSKHLLVTTGNRAKGTLTDPHTGNSKNVEVSWATSERVDATTFQSVGPVDLRGGGVFSHDGKWILDIHGDRLWLRDAVTFREIENSALFADPPVTGGASSVCFSPNMEYLLTWRTSYKPQAFIWYLGRRPDCRRIERVWGPLDNACAAFSPDSKLLLMTGGGESYGMATLFDTDTWRERWSLNSDRVVYYPTRCFFSPDGRFIVIADDDLPGTAGGVNNRTYVIRLLNAADGKQRHAFPAHKSMIFGLTFTPDRKTLITCARDGKVLLWDWAAIEAEIPQERK